MLLRLPKKNTFCLVARRASMKSSARLSHTSPPSASKQDVYIPPDEIKDVPQKWDIIKPKMLKDEILEYLRWKMEGNWSKMSREEQMAIYSISYGKWGPRSEAKNKNGLGNGGKELNLSYILMRTVFNLILLSAAGVSLLNLKRDKETLKEWDHQETAV
ncbi:Mtc3p NDAI_0I03090 [Naumovozyma dairenensis CBS 421]|uniref:Uncharacterized protein n=1 Tax=Naumovozyma dairenensis (strain ATCC 10597 / BCRC 20456 / CBS 421 / NBRC 0211 / NRRL Y-12639) TaxID=1071378 RepID=G0WGG6_NAUDC|nr:hypothetical protein NDAI_0I03090 [Naumovozyma dairenensis CBS 421]CCD26877.1 hypothetical protein NDAI_0I03090 [Naumovozyma dairenensis CBS 421]